MSAAETPFGDGDLVRGGEPRLDEVVASALIDAAPDGIIMVDETGDILLVNRRLEEMFGYGRDDLVGRPVEVLLPESLHKLHRAHRTRFRAEPRTRPMGEGMALRGRRSDGAEFPVEISLSPLRGGDGGRLRVIAAVRDITARVAMEAEAREVRRVLDHTRDAVLMFESDTLHFTYVNQGAIEQLGYSRGELLSMSPLHIKPEFTEASYRALVEELKPGESHSYMTVHRRKDGADIAVEAVLQRPAADVLGGPGWMVSIARDVTDRLAAQERALSAERELALVDDRQRIAMDLHDRVIQRLYAAGLRVEGLRGRTDSAVSERLGQVVDELDESIHELRSSIFGLTVTGSAHSLRATILEECADETQSLGLDPSVRFDGPVDTVDDTTAEQLLAVLREALSNVVRHAHASSVKVTVTVGDQVTLTVRDDGIGPPAGRSGGNGLVNMAARAEALGGRCEVTAADPSGTVVEWQVPLR